MSGPTTRTKVVFRNARQGRRVLGKARKPESPPRVPRVARLLALAIRMEELVQSGEVADYAELARLGRVTRSRMSQIMSLLQLAPDIQEEILFLPAATKGRVPVTKRQLGWRLWRRLIGRGTGEGGGERQRENLDVPLQPRARPASFGPGKDQQASFSAL